MRSVLLALRILDLLANDEGCRDAQAASCIRNWTMISGG